MRILKGMDVELWNGKQFEVVNNVLVGSPSADGCSYTLGIPKGDTNSWIDKKLRFFGRTFRTIGYPQQGIAENIPLYWDKNITAQMLVTNGICTIYEKGTYQKRVYNDIYFTDRRSTATSKTGEILSENLELLIYSVCNPYAEYIPKRGDIIVVGECGFEFDTSSQQAESESVARFRKEYPNFAVVESTQVSQSTVNRDYTITAR